MSNDLIRLAMERAVKLYGDKGDGLFNGAGFSQAFCKLAGLAAGAALDGHVVRAMLTGRGDVEPLKGGSHYRLLRRPQGCAVSFDGQTLVWAWDRPLPAEMLDIAADQLEFAMHSPGPQFLQRLAKRAAAKQLAVAWDAWWTRHGLNSWSDEVRRWIRLGFEGGFSAEMPPGIVADKIAEAAHYMVLTKKAERDGLLDPAIDDVDHAKLSAAMAPIAGTIERCRHCGCEWRCPECDGLPVVRGEHPEIGRGETEVDDAK